MSPDFEVPPGYSKLRITAEFELSYHVTVAGAMRACAETKVEARSSWWGHASARALGTVKGMTVEFIE